MKEENFPANFTKVEDNKVNVQMSLTAQNERSNDLKEFPSLGSLIKKDPNLFDSISEIVQKIDSGIEKGIIVGGIDVLMGKFLDISLQH